MNRSRAPYEQLKQHQQVSISHKERVTQKQEIELKEFRKPVIDIDRKLTSFEDPLDAIAEPKMEDDDECKLKLEFH